MITTKEHGLWISEITAGSVRLAVGGRASAGRRYALGTGTTLVVGCRCRVRPVPIATPRSPRAYWVHPTSTYEGRVNVREPVMPIVRLMEG